MKIIQGPRRLAAARRRAADCRACDLWKTGTQTVFGEGPAGAEVVFVGEQPGDVEDREGRPFVGPAGQLLRHALGAAGFDAAAVYVTNAVKHFKWTPRGKRRLHQKPNLGEVMACRRWLDEELAAIRPRLVVALGATAAQALLGPSVRVTKDRGRFFESTSGATVTVTVHPSSILRAPDPAARDAARRSFDADLKAIRKWLSKTRR